MTSSGFACDGPRWRKWAGMRCTVITENGDETPRTLSSGMQRWRWGRVGATVVTVEEAMIVEASRGNEDEGRFSKKKKKLQPGHLLLQVI
ncbi:carbohydrate esterase family 12 protein [Sesbania bispinosa]|nr:carbohydrate esterase family 12 protein [Sesbania bispinosa]